MPIVSGGGGGAAGALTVGTATRTAGDVTTASASFVDMTGATVTFMPTGAHRCLIIFDASVKHSAAGSSIDFDLLIDGVTVGGTGGVLQVFGPSNNFYFNAGFSFLTGVLTTAAHTAKIQWRTSAATATVQASTTLPLVLTVVELYA